MQREDVVDVGVIDAAGYRCGGDGGCRSGLRGLSERGWNWPVLLVRVQYTVGSSGDQTHATRCLQTSC
jgi:hypothetical protein